MKEGLDVLTEKKAVTFFLVNKHFEEKSIKRGAGLFQEGGMARRGGGSTPMHTMETDLLNAYTI